MPREAPFNDEAGSIAQALAHALSPEARAQFAAEWAASPHPRFGTDPTFPGGIVRYNVDGSKTPGHWTAGGSEALTVPAKRS
jgi:hypothetical protein